MRLFPANNYDSYLGLQQTIYDFDKTSESVALARQKTELATDALEAVKRDLAFRTIQHYYSILFLLQSIQVQDKQIRTLNEHLVTTRSRVTSGTSTDLEVLTTQVRVAAADSRKIELENALRKQESAFRRLAGLAPEEPVKLRGQFSLQPISLNQDSLLTIATANRIEAKTASDAIESATVQKRLARASNKPSVSGLFTYGFKNGYMPNLDVLRGNIVAGLEVKVPIFDGNLTNSMVAEAEANVSTAESRKRDVLQVIQSDVEQALADVQASIDQLQVSEVNIQQAQRAAEVARARYRAGTVTNLDLLDAETALAQAELTHIQALFSYVMGSYQLQRGVGAKFY
jgi:outer membrane protein TolC